MKYLCAPLFFAGLVIMGMLLAGELQALDEPLSIEELKSAVYPSQWTRSGSAPLTDGQYREPAAPASATEQVHKLNFLRCPSAWA